MKATVGLLLTLSVPPSLLAQAAVSPSHPANDAFSTPSFVLHDVKRKVEKPKAVLGPMKDDGAGHTTGSIAFFGGSSLIQVLSLAFSGDGRLLAVGSTPGIVDVWNVDTRKIVRSFVGGTSVALSSDGRWLAKDGKGIEVVDLSSGKTGINIPWSGATIERLSFDPAGKLLLVSSNGKDDKVFELTQGHLVAELTNTRFAQFSLDGALVVGADYKHLVIWDTKTWTQVHDFPNGPEYVTAIAVSPRNDLVVVGGPKTARLRRIDSGVDVTQVSGGYTNFAGFNKTGAPIFIYAGPGLTILNSEGKIECSGSISDSRTFALSPDGRWVATGTVGRLTDVQVWNVDSLVQDCGGRTSVSSP
jgi:WD40 repeat protein